MRWIVALFVLVPLGLSFAPGFPPHGYGLVLLALLPLYAWKRPQHRARLAAYALAIGIGTLAWPDPDLGFLGWILLFPYLWAREREDGTDSVPEREELVTGSLGVVGPDDPTRGDVENEQNVAG